MFSHHLGYDSDRTDFHMFVRHRSFPPLRLPLPDAVHSPDPLHMVSCFKAFAYALTSHHLGDDSIQSFLGLFIQISQIVAEFSLEHKLTIQTGIALFQIPLMHPPPFSDRTIFRREADHRDVTFSMKPIIQVILNVMDFLRQCVLCHIPITPFRQRPLILYITCALDTIFTFIISCCLFICKQKMQGSLRVASLCFVSCKLTIDCVHGGLLLLLL